MYTYVYIYIYTHIHHLAAMRCDMVLHRAFRARLVRRNGIGGDVRHGVHRVFCARHLKHEMFHKELWMLSASQARSTL